MRHNGTRMSAMNYNILFMLICVVRGKKCTLFAKVISGDLNKDKKYYWGARRPLKRVNSLLTVMADCRVILSIVQFLQ